MHERGRFAISFDLSEPVNVESHIGLGGVFALACGYDHWLVGAVVLARRHGTLAHGCGRACLLAWSYQLADAVTLTRGHGRVGPAGMVALARRARSH